MDNKQLYLLEQCTLGSVLMDTKLGEQLISELTRNHFPNLYNVYDVIKEMIVDSRELAPNIIGSKCGLEIVKGVMLSVCQSTDFEEYADGLKEYKFKKELKEHIKKVLDISNDSRKTSNDIATLLSDTPNISNEKIKFRKSNELVNEYIADVAQRRISDDDIEGLRTGFDKLDRLVGGMKPGETIGVKAESNVGKSLFTKDIAVNVARAGYRVDLFSYEMSNKRTMGRILPTVSEIPAKVFKYPKELFDKKRQSELANTDVEFLHDNLYVYADELKEKTVEEIRYMINKTNIREGSTPDLIIVDYLQYLAYDVKMKDWEGSRLNNEKLKDLARKYNCPVIIIVANAKDGTISGSGKILYDMDQVWELLRDVNNEEEALTRIAELKVVKSRASETGSIPLTFEKEFIRFKEMKQW